MATLWQPIHNSDFAIGSCAVEECGRAIIGTPPRTGGTASRNPGSLFNIQYSGSVPDPFWDLHIRFSAPCRPDERLFVFLLQVPGSAFLFSLLSFNLLPLRSSSPERNVCWSASVVHQNAYRIPCTPPSPVLDYKPQNGRKPLLRSAHAHPFMPMHRRVRRDFHTLHARPWSSDLLHQPNFFWSLHRVPLRHFRVAAPPSACAPSAE